MLQVSTGELRARAKFLDISAGRKHGAVATGVSAMGATVRLSRTGDAISLGPRRGGFGRKPGLACLSGGAYLCLFTV